MEKDGRHRTITPNWLPEKFQTVAGCVNHAEKWNVDFKKASNLKREVNVWPCLYKTEKRLNSNSLQETELFTCKRQKSTGNNMLFLSAARQDKRN